MTKRTNQIWDPVLRLLHWGAALCFVLNYWVLPQGEFWHRFVGYSLLVITILRLIWGMLGPPRARFSKTVLQSAVWQHHFQQIKQRQFSADMGHNPFGYLWLYLALSLFLALATTGFLLEEIDYFFGSDALESLHGLLADSLFLFACLHVVAVIVLQWWGKIALIMPMITGRRRH